MTLGPKNHLEAVIYAEENLRVDFQHRLQTLLNKRKLSRKDLAFRAGMTEQAVSRLFSTKANPRLDTIARLFLALREECVITSTSEMAQRSKQAEVERFHIVSCEPGNADAAAFSSWLKEPQHEVGAEFEVKPPDSAGPVSLRPVCAA